MASRNGINVNSIPFEQRCPRRPRRRNREKLTLTDRFVCAFCGAFLGLLLWTFGYLFLVSAALKASARQPANAQAAVDPIGRLPSFWWGWTVIAGFSLFGASVGPEPMMDGFVNVLRVETEVGRAVSRS